MTRCPVLLLFIVQSSLAYRQDSFADSRQNYIVYPDETVDDLNNFDSDKRSNHFLRFGRNEEKYRSEYEDFDELSTPTRATKREKNDNFARFGRNQDFLRFGRNPENVLRRDSEMYNRAGELFLSYF